MDEHFVLRVPKNLPLAELPRCFAPASHYSRCAIESCRRKVGIVGLASWHMGSNSRAPSDARRGFTTSPGKKDDASGSAHEVVLSRNAEE